MLKATRNPPTPLTPARVGEVSREELQTLLAGAMKHGLKNEPVPLDAVFTRDGTEQLLRAPPDRARRAVEFLGHTHSPWYRSEGGVVQHPERLNFHNVRRALEVFFFHGVHAVRIHDLNAIVAGTLRQESATLSSILDPEAVETLRSLLEENEARGFEMELPSCFVAVLAERFGQRGAHAPKLSPGDVREALTDAQVRAIGRTPSSFVSREMDKRISVQPAKTPGLFDVKVRWLDRSRSYDGLSGEALVAIVHTLDDVSAEAQNQHAMPDEPTDRFTQD